MRYRSPRIVPGAKPPPSSEGDEARRPTGLSDAPRRNTASATDGVARPVANCEEDPVGAPQAGQKRLPSASSVEHEVHRMYCLETWRECYYRAISTNAFSVAVSSAFAPTGAPVACSIQMSGAMLPRRAIRSNSGPIDPAFSICCSI